jgi:class 3 adenylate cyclase
MSEPRREPAAGRGAASTRADQLQLLEEQIRSINRFPDQNPHPVMRISPAGELLYANVASEPLLQALGAAVGEPVPEPYRTALLRACREAAGRTVEVVSGHRTYAVLAVDVPDLGVINLYGTDVTAQKVVAKFPDQNPNPVLRISPGGELLYHNAASAPLVEALSLRRGQRLPRELLESLRARLAGKTSEPLEQTAGELVFALRPVEVPEFGFINIYGTDVTAVQRLAEAHATNQRLLLNILPPAIAERLLAGEKVIADRYDDVTLLFADIVDFTIMSSRLSANQVVELLNEVFSVTDELADRYALEKIKTVGDAYMVVGGLPEESTDHTSRVADMALELRSTLRRIRSKARQPISVRIGIHRGPAVAGVIGTRKFIYDVWGDTVNTASRMESHGVPDRIQVTEPVALSLGSEFRFERRGVIDIKGKGPMETWFLLGRAAPAG